jgi:hypothetical protein
MSKNKYNQLTKLNVGATDLKNVQLILSKLVECGEINTQTTALDIVKKCTLLIDEINSGVVDRNNQIELKK